MIFDMEWHKLRTEMGKKRDVLQEADVVKNRKRTKNKQYGQYNLYAREILARKVE